MLTNNSLQIETISCSSHSELASSIKVSLPGHHSMVRTLAFSSDNTAIMSGSAESIKIWNRLVLTINILLCLKNDVMVLNKTHALGYNDNKDITNF